MFQVSQQDVPARMRLLRYGLIVVTVTTFLVSFFALFTAFSAIGAQVGMGAIIGRSLIYTVVVAVIAAVVYFGYGAILKNTVDGDS